MEAVVRLRDAHRLYVTAGETVHALDGVDLKIAPREFVVIAGPSGSGKSTLLNLVGALDRPTSGTVEIDGRSLSNLSASQLAALRRDRIGFIFQAYNLVPVLSALENVEYVMLLQGVPRAERGRRARETLELVGLRGLEKRRPAELSGGQQQRVAVARALAAHPALVLADEPTANLDSHTSAALMDLLAQLNREQGTTIVCSTHDPALIGRAPRVVRLRDGKIEGDERVAA